MIDKKYLEGFSNNRDRGDTVVLLPAEDDELMELNQRIGNLMHKTNEIHEELKGIRQYLLYIMKKRKQHESGYNPQGN